MKRLLATTALVAIMASPAMAQQNDQQMSSNAATMEQTQSAQYAAGENMTIQVSNLMGRTLYMQGEGAQDGQAQGEQAQGEGITDAPENWQDVADISDVLITPEGDITAVVVDAGGFLGMGEKRTRIGIDQIRFVPDADDEGEFFAVFTGDRQVLEDQVAYNAEDVGPEGTGSDYAELSTQDTYARTESDTLGEGEMTAEGQTGEGTTEDQQMAEGQTGEGATEDEQMAEGQTGEGEDFTEDRLAEQNEMVTDGQGTEQAMTDDQAQTDGQGTEQAMTDDQAQTEGQGTEQAMTDDQAQTAEDQQTAENRVGPDPASLDPVDVAELTADDLEGARVYGANNDWVGEVGELVITEQGDISHVVVDVGGFLGIGEKPVAMPFDQLDIRRDGGWGGLNVYVDATEEELDSMERWEQRG